METDGISSERFVIPFIDHITSENEIVSSIYHIYTDKTYDIERIFDIKYRIGLDGTRLIIHPHKIKWEVCKLTSYGSIQSCSIYSGPISLSEVNFQFNGTQYTFNLDIEPNDFVIELRFNREKETTGTTVKPSEIPQPLIFIYCGKRDYLKTEKHFSFPERDVSGNWIFRKENSGQFTKSVR